MTDKTLSSSGDLRQLMAKASPARSGDYLAEVAAESAEERMAARIALADVPLKAFLQQVLVPYEQDEVTRLIIVDTKQIDRIGEFAKIIHKPYVKIHLYDHHPNTDKDFDAELDIIEDVGATTSSL